MRRGTLSLLIGAHQLIVHPVAVTIAFRKLYHRWPGWKEAVCIIVHDWGYWRCRDIDGPEGSNHPRLGARIADELFGGWAHDWCYYHSRHLAKRDGVKPSKLCWADKLGTAITPWWLYLPGATLSGEIEEYRISAHRYHLRTGRGISLSASNREWFDWMIVYMRKVAVQQNSTHQLEQQ